MDLGRETFFLIVFVLRVLSPKAEHCPARAPCSTAVLWPNHLGLPGQRTPAVLVPRLLMRGGCGPPGRWLRPVSLCAHGGASVQDV